MTSEKAKLIPNCRAEIHFEDEGVGRSCSREVGHDGAHYSMKQVPHGYTPIAWTGDDRAEAQR